MDERQAKGREIADLSTLTQKDNLWLVPSQVGRGSYKVDPEARKCTCPDFEFHHADCKHIYAVEITLQRTQVTKTTDGETTVTKVVTETVKVSRKTYRQAWPQYNAAQTHEKERFLSLLHELCAGIEEPIQTFGRPRLSFADMIFCVSFKIYSTVSGRRFMSDLRDAHGKNYIAKLPHYNSIFRYLESGAMTAYLTELITRSAMPLKALEKDFALDSSGFSTNQFCRWFDTKYGQNEQKREWIKLHLMCGTLTNVVTSVEVSKQYANDCPYFKPLVEKTSKSGFTMAETSADKAYLSADNMRIALTKGARPYIPFKGNSQAGENTTLWNRMFHYFNFNRDEFLTHYHKRSNVETVFSMIKMKFGERLRSKSETAQINEALCKVLCHNLCCVIQSIFEMNIEPTFWAETALAS